MDTHTVIRLASESRIEDLSDGVRERLFRAFRPVSDFAFNEGMAVGTSAGWATVFGGWVLIDLWAWALAGDPGLIGFRFGAFAFSIAFHSLAKTAAQKRLYGSECATYDEGVTRKVVARRPDRSRHNAGL